MIGTFKANNPYNTFLLLIYGLLIKLPVLLHPVVPVAQPNDGFLFKLLLQQLAGFGHTVPRVYAVISFFLLFLQALLFNNFANSQRLMQKPNYLAAMAYLLLTSLFPEWNMLSAPMVVNTFLIWVWASMGSLYNEKNPKSMLFNIGLALGLATFFNFPSIVFLLLIIVGLFVTRPFRFSEWLIPLLGMMTPYYFLLAYIFLTDQWQGYQWPQFLFSLPHLSLSRWSSAALAMLFIGAVTGLYFIQQNFRRQLVQTRKNWNLVFLYFLVALFVPFVNAADSFQYWILAAVPLSVFLACAFLYPTKKWFPQLLHWAMVAFIIAFSYFGHK